MNALVFVTQAGETSQSPGSVVRSVRLQAVNPKDSVDNAKLFVAGGPNVVGVELTGLTAEQAEAFTGGQQFQLSLTPVPAVPAA